MKNSIRFFLIVLIPLVFVCKPEAIAQNSDNKAQETKLSVGEQIVEKYACLECHKVYGPKVGPAYNGIGDKYRKEFGEHAADSIAVYIKKGSKGKYTCSQLKNEEMDSFDISEEERMAIAEWIVSLRPMKDMNKGKNRK